MKYQKIIKLLYDTMNEPSKFRRKNWVEVNDESRETNDYNSDIKFKTSTIKSIDVTNVMHTYMLKQL